MRSSPDRARALPESRRGIAAGLREWSWVDVDVDNDVDDVDVEKEDCLTILVDDDGGVIIKNGNVCWCCCIETPAVVKDATCMVCSSITRSDDRRTAWCMMIPSWFASSLRFSWVQVE